MTNAGDGLSLLRRGGREQRAGAAEQDPVELALAKLVQKVPDVYKRQGEIGRHPAVTREIFVNLFLFPFTLPLFCYMMGASHIKGGIHVE